MFNPNVWFWNSGITTWLDSVQSFWQSQDNQFKPSIPQQKKTISIDEIKNLVGNAPEWTDPKSILQELRNRGYELPYENEVKSKIEEQTQKKTEFEKTLKDRKQEVEQSWKQSFWSNSFKEVMAPTVFAWKTLLSAWQEVATAPSKLLAWWLELGAKWVDYAFGTNLEPWAEKFKSFVWESQKWSLESIWLNPEDVSTKVWQFTADTALSAAINPLTYAWAWIASKWGQFLYNSMIAWPTDMALYTLTSEGRLPTKNELNLSTLAWPLSAVWEKLAPLIKKWYNNTTDWTMGLLWIKKELPETEQKVIDQALSHTKPWQDKLFKAQNPSVNLLAKNRDINAIKEKAGIANQAIIDNHIQNGWILPKNTQERVDATLDTLKNVWKEVNDILVSKWESTSINMNNAADAVEWYLKKNPALKDQDTLTATKINQLIDNLRNAWEKDANYALNARQVFNWMAEYGKHEWVSDAYNNALKVATKSLRDELDNKLSTLPWEFSTLNKKYWALSETLDDVIKTNVVNLRKKWTPLEETYSRIEGIGDILNWLTWFISGKWDIGRTVWWVAKLAVWKALAKQKNPDYLVEKWFQELYNSISDNFKWLSLKDLPVEMQAKIKAHPEASWILQNITDKVKQAWNAIWETIAKNADNIPTQKRWAVWIWTPEEVLKNRELADSFNKVGTTENAVKENASRLSSKFIEDIKPFISKDTTRKEFVQNYLKRWWYKDAEINMIKSILNDMPDKFNKNEFYNKVKSEVLPLETKDVDKHANFNQLRSANKYPVDKAYTRIYEAPFNTKVWNVHFEWLTDKYFANSRFEDVWNNRYMIEVQSDLFQKKRYLNEDYEAGFADKLKNIIDQSYDLRQLKNKDLIISDKYKEMMDKWEYFSAMKLFHNENNMTEANQSLTNLLTNLDAIKYPSNNLNKAIEERLTNLSKEKERLNADYKKWKKYWTILENYKDNWQERIIKEEIKRAWEDGMQSLKIPTWDTLAKIEWFYNTFGEKAKFSKEANAVVDFYDKKVIPYVKKLRKDAQIVQDKHTWAEWIEIPIKKEDATRPILAYQHLLTWWWAAALWWMLLQWQDKEQF